MKSIIIFDFFLGCFPSLTSFSGNGGAKFSRKFEPTEQTTTAYADGRDSQNDEARMTNEELMTKPE